ncbi:nicotinamide riboside kinase 1 [Phialemonium atrogriseum]|uniref:Nicotinamide riboside kinase 1 n=1 Tax=Phialemonium atrogriseum TaxID=1093897 RepID=A0AAJ0FRZ3_9PEZI|nr:nicotinamide riboside kinase 1 [Phialemonium atrogriseum]KAK1772949.1 nicotinamide riboside kinase 1 [Phialemonium atrogriseum]
MGKERAVVIGISGCSSSGKTTLARLLRDIFPNTFILHEDDFYKPEDQLPLKDGLVDWDCPEAISVPDMVRALSHIRATGTFPPDVHSKEDQNSVGPCPVSDAKIASLRARVEAWLQPGQPGHAILGGGGGGGARRLCLLDGFLLYSASVAPVTDAIDVRLFLLASRAAATRRRATRDGYVTLEGFWRDPPGYVDRVVWPNYEAAHAWLFEGGDVQGEPRRDVLARERIRVQLGKGLDVDMETTLEWAVDTIMGDLEAFVGRMSFD